jgi:hypothetical protein
MRFHLIALAALVPSMTAQASPLKPDLSGLSFLVGDWSSGRGKVADTGGTSTGTSSVTPEAGGAVLLRRDHTNLYSASGDPAGGFDQIMMIYTEAGQLRADYADGTHIIHYISATVDPGRSVVFTTALIPGAPLFKLAYTMTNASTLAVAFSMVPPGGSSPRPIATGTLTKVK